MLLEKTSSLEDRWCEVFGELGTPRAIVACTYAFSADYFKALLERWAEVACVGRDTDEPSFSSIPVDVVCDRARYAGHHIGFNVTWWPIKGRLFHPKLVLALFEDEVVWSDGSLNLTPSGWQRNREVAMLHRPGRKVLPRELRELLAALPGVAGAKHILDGTTSLAPGQGPGDFLTSLTRPIGTRYLSAGPRLASEVHLVAPFFEANESHGASIDEGWLRALAERYPDALFHVYLPCLDAEPLRLQGSRTLFEAAEQILDQPIVFHPVMPAPGPLHGKVACVFFRRWSVEYAHVLVGSANMTRAALMARGPRANVETSWILELRAKAARRFLRELGRETCSLADADFTDPKIKPSKTWNPLEKAVYDPVKRTLRLSWRSEQEARATILTYAGKALALTDLGVHRNFGLVDDVAWLVTTKRRGEELPGCCPIEVPVAVLPACRGGTLERSPEDWLRLLGATSSEAAPRIGKKGEGSTAGRALEADDFEWSERVRDLTARTRFLVDSLSNEDAIATEREWLLKLLQQIYDAHDPAAAAEGQDEVWRSWVRVELWQAAEQLGSIVASRRERQAWRLRASRLKKGIVGPACEPTVRAQLQTLVRALGRAS